MNFDTDFGLDLENYSDIQRLKKQRKSVPKDVGIYTCFKKTIYCVLWGLRKGFIKGKNFILNLF